MLANQAADSAPRALALLPWALAAVALHVAWLWPAVETPLKPSAAPLALQLRAAAPRAEPGLPSPEPSAAERSEASPSPQSTRAPGDRPVSAVDLPQPARGTAAVATDPLPLAEPAPAGAAPLSLPQATRWTYALVHDGVDGEAWLDWQPEGERYTLVLQRRTPTRALPRWESQGELSALGLAPRRFAVQRGRHGQRVIHDAGAEPSAQQQDRLSWMLQLPALLQTQSQAQPQAQSQARTAELWVVDWRGRAQPWRFERVGLEALTLPDGQTRDTQRWRRVPQGQAQAEIELWLDPAEGFRPLRLVHKVLGDERWELLWNPAASAPNP